MEDLLLIKREIEILKIIKHRNILTLYEIYESKDYIFLVMEYIPGKNLCEMIVTKRRFKEDEAKIIFVQIVDALYYLHKMNICHRNITSNHILFDNNNIPKLISFSYSTFIQKIKN
jgi:serine/threonine protein kinase